MALPASLAASHPRATIWSWFFELTPVYLSFATHREITAINDAGYVRSVMASDAPAHSGNLILVSKFRLNRSHPVRASKQRVHMSRRRRPCWALAGFSCE